MEKNIGKICPKCSHKRSEHDSGLPSTCPACGAIYAKVEAHLRALAEAQQKQAGGGTARRYQPAFNVNEDMATESLRLAHIMYVMYVLSLVLVVTAIAGVILAHTTRSAPRQDWLDSHLLWMRNTFWLSLLICPMLMLLGALLLMALFPASSQGPGSLLAQYYLIGVKVMGAALGVLAFFFWYARRIARGWVHLFRGEALSD